MQENQSSNGLQIPCLTEWDWRILRSGEQLYAGRNKGNFL